MNCRKLSNVKSTKALFVFHQAPVSCQIWFFCDGRLINTRSKSLSSDLASIDTQLTINNDGATLAMISHGHEEHNNNLKHFKSSKCKENWASGGGSSSLTMGEMTTDGFFLSMTKSLDLTSSTVEHKVNQVRKTNDELEQVMADAENAKQRAFEESVRRWRAEEDAAEAMQLARVSESLCLEEINRCKEMEVLLVRQRQELGILKDEHDKLLMQLQMIQDQKPCLELQIAENCRMEDELEKKIIQAVNLLISFKEKRDMLQIERDNAIETVNRLRKSVEEDAARLSLLQFFSLSFSDIVKATRNFDQSLKIGEGRLGTVYKGTINHVEVSIRMLPSCGSLSDLDFKRNAEVLSRVRHPNLVTIYGVCTECRSLVYEYLENGSLEDHLTGRYKTKPLSFQTRVRVAFEICSLLIFLHKNKNAGIHGNLRTDKILLDANFVSKLSDLGVHHLASQNANRNDVEALTYLDPDTSENGELTSESDIYSFGILVLRLLTARPVSVVIRDVKCAMDAGNLDTVLDYSAGDWPLEQTKELASLALRCSEEKRINRPDLVAEVWPIIESMKDVYSYSPVNSASPLKSQGQRRIPPHFVCPILQEVMSDPYIAADGFTYEADAIKGWLDSGHKTSPMTNLQLQHTDLLPNYALYYAIQEWQEQS